jgi:hypothetical protein
MHKYAVVMNGRRRVSDYTIHPSQIFSIGISLTDPHVANAL